MKFTFLFGSIHLLDYYCAKRQENKDNKSLKLDKRKLFRLPIHLLGKMCKYVMNIVVAVVALV